MNKPPEMARMEADLAASEALREKFEATMKRIAEAGEAKSDGELFEKAAAELGYQITAAELERLSAANEELSPEEMELVAGGEEDYSREDSDGHDHSCIVAWHCFTITCHTKANKGNENVSCWLDYICMIINRDPPHRK